VGWVIRGVCDLVCLCVCPQYVKENEVKCASAAGSRCCRRGAARRMTAQVFISASLSINISAMV